MTAVSPSTTYLARAECNIDVARFFRRLTMCGVAFERRSCVSDVEFSDVQFGLVTLASLGELLDCAREVEDGHVILQTLQPEGSYTGERDYDRD
jgi:hypothetical protein